MSTITTNPKAIHCKVFCNDQIRRFLLRSTEFRSLFGQVQSVLSMNKEFVLKYKDTEGDLITLSSDDELACALLYSGNVLRLVAVPVGEKDPETTPHDFHPFAHGYPHPYAPGFHHPFAHGYHHPHPFAPGYHHPYAHDFYNFHGCGPYSPHFPYAKYGCGKFRGGKWGLKAKRDFFTSQLEELEKVAEKTPEQERQILVFQNKLKKIDSRIERGGEDKEVGGKRAEKWAVKEEKRKRKEEKRTQKGRRVLSEETQTQIAVLKSQIDLLKPGLEEVKSQLKSKKAAVREAKARGIDPRPLLKEISGLKEARNEKKNALKPLKEKIRELKYTPC